MGDENMTDIQQYIIVHRVTGETHCEVFLTRAAARHAKRILECEDGMNRPPHYQIQLGPGHKHYRDPLHEQTVR